MTDAQNNYDAWIDVTTGTNTITVQAEHYSPNANTATRSWQVNITGGPARTFTYDANGNTLSDGQRAYHWISRDPIAENGGINLYAYVANNPVTFYDPYGLDAVDAPGGGYNFIVRPGLNLDHLAGSIITHPRFSGECATGAQFLTGTLVNGRIHDAPPTPTWRPGEPVGPNMRPGTMVATGWDNGRYPSAPASDYQRGGRREGQTVNHAGIFLGMNRGMALIFDQSAGRPLGVTPTNPKGWHAVVSDRKYDSKPSECAARATRP